MRRGATPRATVLVCDDEPSARKVLSAWLGRKGYRVVTAADGDEALEHVRRVQPDVILLDIMLPKRDGYTVLAHLRGGETHRRTPVFMVSAEPEAVHADALQAMGADGYIGKPFDLEKIERAVAEALRAHTGEDRR